MKRLIAIFAMLVLSGLSAVAFALPSVEDVQTEVKQGHYTQAESMMREVVAAKPNSAKARYIYAEILAHNKRFDQAAEEARLARQLDPKITFTDAGKFSSFEQLLQREQSAAKSSVQSTPAPRVSTRTDAAPVERSTGASSSGMPGWVWGLGFAVIAVVVWRMLAARRSSAMSPGSAGYQAAPASYGVGSPGYNANTNYGGGYGPAGYGPGAQPARGSGMLGTGLAAAGGFAAGMLAEKMLDGRHGSADTSRAAASDGLSPGMFDDGSSSSFDNAAAQELEQRSVDFGGGGNDWDSGGSSDGGSSGGSDDGGW